MKTPYLLGIITALLFGSFAMSGFYAQAGMEGLTVVHVKPQSITIQGGNPSDTSTATCPPGTQLIGGDHELRLTIPLGELYQDFKIEKEPDFTTNEYNVVGTWLGDPIFGGVNFAAVAFCATLTFPMGMSMIGGELLDLDTMALFIGAIGVNPVITGLVAITMGGVAAQAIWFVNSRRVKKVE